MRFCPFCSAENAEEASHCVTCSRRLPPLPARRRAHTGAARSTSASVSTQPTAEPASHDPEARSRPWPSPSPASHREPRSSVEVRQSHQPARRRSDVHVAESATAPPPSVDAVGKHNAPQPTRSRMAHGSSPDADPVAERPVSPVSKPPRRPRTRVTAGPYDEWPSPTRTEEVAPDPDDWAAEAESALREVPLIGSEGEHARPQRARTSQGRRQVPPTRVGVIDNFRPPKVRPIPEIPDRGLLPAAKYLLAFVPAWWRRRGIIRDLNAEIKEQTASLDGVLGALGAQVRALKIDNRVLSAENEAINEAEKKRGRLEQENAELGTRLAEENAKFADLEAERQTKLDEAESALAKAHADVIGLDAQRRGLRDKHKTITRTQRGYLKAADDREEQSAKAAMGDTRASLRRAAEELRRDAADLDPERQDLDRRLTAMEKPISQAMAKEEALKSEVESARRSLNDAREGHRHRLAELDGEQGKKTREVMQAESEIQRRLVTLGTLINLHRVDEPEFDELYSRVDTLRGAIGARSGEIDRLTAERAAYDKGSLIRGGAAIAGAAVIAICLIAILLWVL